VFGIEDEVLPADFGLDAAFICGDEFREKMIEISNSEVVRLRFMEPPGPL
jgi:hypothetical protein